MATKVLPLKRILALPTWGEIHTVSVIHPFISDFFQMEHPVRWSFIQEKFSPFLSSLFCRKNSSSKPRRINTISNNEENRSPLHNVILQDVVVHNYATVNDIKKVVSFLSSRQVYSKLLFPKTRCKSNNNNSPHSSHVHFHTTTKIDAPSRNKKNIQWTSILPLSSVVY